MELARAAVDAPELVEGWVAGGPRPVVVPVEPLGRIHSPILESRRTERTASDHVSTFVIPPLNELASPSGVALLIAAPLLVLVGWQLALIAVVTVTIVREVERRIPASYSLAAAFMGYRPDDGWPQGVQEDDDVRWNWSASFKGSSHAAPSQDRA